MGKAGRMRADCPSRHDPQCLPLILPSVPQASCRDCELQVAASSKEVLDTFCASDFGEQHILHAPSKNSHSGPWLSGTVS